MNKKPEIFKPEVGNINNNKKSYYSFLDDKLNIEREEKTIYQKVVPIYLEKT